MFSVEWWSFILVMWTGFSTLSWSCIATHPEYNHGAAVPTVKKPCSRLSPFFYLFHVVAYGRQAFGRLLRDVVPGVCSEPAWPPAIRESCAQIH